MKYILLIVVTFLCIGSSFWGCQKEDLGNLDGIFSDTTQATPTAIMTAKVNDTPWTALSTTASISAGKISLTGVSSAGEKINLTVYSSVAGDFLLKPGSLDTARYYMDSLPKTTPYFAYINANTGGVIDVATVDTVNEVMSGYFNFFAAKSATGKSVDVISEGVFSNISFVNLKSTSPFAVKKNGKPWKATATTAISGSEIIITATNATKDTTLTLKMPVSVTASVKPYPIALTGNFTASVQEKTYTLSLDTTAAILTKYKIKPVITILSNDVATKTIHGNFSFVADYVKGKTTILATFNAGTFYLKY